MHEKCPSCKGALSLINFDGVAAEFLCLPCFNPRGRNDGATPAQVRWDRRTAGGTMPALPERAYAEVRASGPCVYCGAPAAAADHVRPLARGGLDVPENLVPACTPCNNRKKDRLLTEWVYARVERAAGVSPLVAAELRRLQNA